MGNEDRLGPQPAGERVGGRANAAAAAAADALPPVPDLDDLSALAAPKSVKDYFEKVSKPVVHRPGKRVNNQPRPDEYAQWDFIKHGNQRQWKPVASLSETKFHKGFQRRPRENIPAYHATERQIETMPFRASTSRREKLQYISRDCREYDIISGNDVRRPRTSASSQYREALPSFSDAAQERPRGRRHFQPPPSALHEPKSARTGRFPPVLATRQNPSPAFRFFYAPQASDKTRRRAEILSRDGVRLGKKSSELGFGRPDLTSRGVEDNFGNSFFLQQCKSTASITKMLGAI